MAFLFLFFTVVLSLCVVGLIVLALSSILGSVRDDWKLKKPKRERVREITDLGHYCRSNPLTSHSSSSGGGSIVAQTGLRASALSVCFDGRIGSSLDALLMRDAPP
jgi:hypothetical protein